MVLFLNNPNVGATQDYRPMKQGLAGIPEGGIMDARCRESTLTPTRLLIFFAVKRLLC
jgi:hypothetical protein